MTTQTQAPQQVAVPSLALVDRASNTIFGTFNNGFYTFTPAHAQWIWDSVAGCSGPQAISNYQRPLSKQKVELLQSEMVAGNYMAATSPIIFGVDELTGDVYLLNGQHRMNALRKCAPDTQVTFLVVVEYGSVDDLLNKVYPATDTNRIRGTDTALHAMKLDTVFGLKRSTLRRHASAIRLLKNYIKTGKFVQDCEATRYDYATPKKIFDAMEPFGNALSLLDTLIYRSKVEAQMRAAPVEAVLLPILDHPLGAGFISRIAGNKSDPTGACQLVYNDLLNQKSGNTRRNEKTLARRVMYAWEKFVLGHQVSSLDATPHQIELKFTKIQGKHTLMF